MSKPATLASCIAKMYEGAKLDTSGATSGTPNSKKPNSTLQGTLGIIEGKINHLEGRVDQIANTQTLVLQKLDSVCQGMSALEKHLAQLRVDAPHQSADHAATDPAISEVRSLCGETVSLLKGLRQEGQVQRRKIEGIENSVSTLDKVLGYVGEAFRSSKIVEFILSGVVPWRKQGLLNAADEEVGLLLLPGILGLGF